VKETEEKDKLSVLDVAWDARDSHLAAKGGEATLLLMLALRTDPKKKYSCFPGYGQLKEDSGLNIKTLKAAAAALEKKNLVKRVVRPNHSNLWYINVKLLHETAEKNRAADKRAKNNYDDCPFEAPVLNVTSAPVPAPANTDTDKDDDGVEGFIPSSPRPCLASGSCSLPVFSNVRHPCGSKGLL
jgi:DNA-binding MarR family transcriptional regulator